MENFLFCICHKQDQRPIRLAGSTVIMTGRISNLRWVLSGGSSDFDSIASSYKNIIKKILSKKNHFNLDFFLKANEILFRESRIKVIKQIIEKNSLFEILSNLNFFNHFQSLKLTKDEF
ncbi:hypothetical protein BpHYR1_042280 [Brachionus plicatilis]|uniref:Uncharacterized protein n=1 Tax=Brachionus plicatilis TaxID=10195 RepID=A0A3M7R542_BRAPC|nr:hypothetical protein BpHYR1_042280 [Brachionus plicatilis]